MLDDGMPGDWREQLIQHAKIAEAVLRAAREHARVDIVTLAGEVWFEKSAAFLPGVEMKKLLAELDINVYFAIKPDQEEFDERDLMARARRNSALVKAKKAAMVLSISSRFGVWDEATFSRCRWNVLSIGDQPEERLALKRLCAEVLLKFKLRRKMAPI